MINDGYGSRYDGKGAPVWHDHLFPVPPYDDFDNSDFRFDAVEFSNGQFAVWSAKTKLIVAYKQSRRAAIEEAQHRAQQEYDRRDQA